MKPIEDQFRPIFMDYGLEPSFSAAPLWGDGSPSTRLMLHSQYGDAEFTAIHTPQMTHEKVVSVEPNLGRHSRLFVLGEHISPRSADVLRRMDISYLDLSGNAFIRFHGVLVDVRGRMRTVEKSRTSLDKETNLFSAKRAQVVFALLSWPRLLDSPLRLIAGVSGASVGLVQDTLGLLERMGYLTPGNRTEIRRRDALIDLWTAAYSSGLGPSLRLREFFGQADAPVFDSPSDISVSGESAVPAFIRATTLTLYVEHFSPKMALQNQWRADRDPNIFLRKKFWNDRFLPALNESAGLLPRAPALLVYADLMASDDSRQAEAANHLRNQPHGL